MDERDAVLTIIHAVPGRVMTPERLQGVELLAEPEPMKTFATDTNIGTNTPRVFRPRQAMAVLRNHPLAHTPKARWQWSGSEPRRFQLCDDVLHGRKTIEDTIVKLLEVSPNAQQRAARGDTGYARITVENADAAVARKCLCLLVILIDQSLQALNDTWGERGAVV
jgi:hypothetical protein